MFCALLGQDSGERLQDHWSSGIKVPCKYKLHSIQFSVNSLRAFMPNMIS